MMSKSQTTTNNQPLNIHPGEVLLEEFLKPMKITAYKLAKDVKIPQTRVSEIIHGRRSVTADTALRLARYFGTSATFWLNLQMLYDLEEVELTKREEISRIECVVTKEG